MLQDGDRPHVKVARWSITEDAITPHGHSYTRQGHMLIELPNVFHRLHPKLEEDGAFAFPGPSSPAGAGVLVGQLCEEDVARLCQAARRRWEGGGGLGDDRCQRCGGRLARGNGDSLHPVCSQYELAWAKMLDGNCKAWLCDQRAELPQLPALGFARWPEGEGGAGDGRIREGRSRRCGHGHGEYGADRWNAPHRAMGGDEQLPAKCRRWR